MRKTRLNKFVSERASRFLLHWYKEAKKTHDIEVILLFKSFVRKMIEAQDEYDIYGRKEWTDVDSYIYSVLNNKEHLKNYDCKNPLNFIIKTTNTPGSGPFDYRKKKDFLKLL
jgi:hypothetical protein